MRFGKPLVLLSLVSWGGNFASL